MDEKEKLEEIRSDLEFKRPSKAKIAGLTVIAVVFGGLLTIGPQLFEEMSQLQDSQQANLTIEINQRSVQPFRPTISRQENVRFVNNAETEVEVRFESLLDSFTLKPGESTVKNIDQIVYYTVDAADEETEFREIKAGINVQ